MARDFRTPCVALCGSIGEGIEELYAMGVDGVFSLCKEPMELNMAIKNGALLLEETTEQVVRLFCRARQH